MLPRESVEEGEEEEEGTYRVSRIDAGVDDVGACAGAAGGIVEVARGAGGAGGDAGETPGGVGLFDVVGFYDGVLLNVLDLIPLCQYSSPSASMGRGTPYIRMISQEIKSLLIQLPRESIKSTIVHMLCSVEAQGADRIVEGRQGAAVFELDNVGVRDEGVDVS